MDLKKDAQESLKLAKTRGTFGRFQLDNISYYPSEDIKEKVAQIIYGVDLVSKGLFDSPEYNKMKDEGRHPINVQNPFSHTKVEGEVLLLNEESGLVVCLLDIKRFLDKNYPERNLAIISQNALPPNYHQVRAVGEMGSIYTTDRDGSTWSLH